MKRKPKVKVERRWGVWDRDRKILLYVMQSSEVAAQSEIDKFKDWLPYGVPVKIEVRYTVPERKERK